MGEHAEHGELVAKLARDDWFRNETWSPEVEAKFFDRLARARTIANKGQYLRIQAVTLAESRPDIALRLLEVYFELGDHFELGLAHRLRGDARRRLGDIPGALSSYQAALEHDKKSNLKSGAELDFALLVAEEQREDSYNEALTLLDAIYARPTFPIEVFLACAGRALIYSNTARVPEAKVAAREALSAAKVDHSGFSRHPTIGLVGVKQAHLLEEMHRIAR